MLKDLTELIDQAELSDECPCGSHLKFGACCGSLFLCDCKSQLSAKDCCYSEEDQDLSQSETAY